MNEIKQCRLGEGYSVHLAQERPVDDDASLEVSCDSVKLFCPEDCSLVGPVEFSYEHRAPSDDDLISEIDKDLITADRYLYCLKMTARMASCPAYHLRDSLKPRETA